MARDGDRVQITVTLRICQDGRDHVPTGAELADAVSLLLSEFGMSVEQTRVRNLNPAWDQEPEEERR